MSDKNKPEETRNAPENTDIPENKAAEEPQDAEVVAHAADGEELPWCFGCSK